ncbi:hypothetical protein DYB32_008958 [Aphanomyces invadans]|uniref:NAA35-like TPR repeats domain-containing protein n=1 Tax=Aphanomyces invadans TaxID=157072 RepID=A0A3R6WG03_9STRA|nr:hypothetical protein DYB32_008958 [Aphanomyces invadans]
MYGKYNFMDWLADSMVMNGVPSVLLSTQEGIGFSTRCIEAVYESLKCHLHNRPRQRHRLELLLDEWAQLQVDAASIDDKFVTEMGIPKASYPRYFTSWALEQTSALMIHYLTLGFELDIYALSEYSTIYWYLDYLLGSRIQNLTNAWSFVEKLKSFTTSERAKTTPPPAPAAPPKSKKKGTKKSKGTVSNGTLTAAAATPEDERAVYLKEKYAWNLALLESHRGLTRALFQVQVVYQSADECFKVARARVENVLALASPDREHTVPELKALVKVCIANAVYLHQYSKQQQQAKMLETLSITDKAPQVVVKFDIHPTYPAIQVKDRAEK